MKPEILSPAGNMEKLKSAFLWGADAVYLAGQRFGMRAAAGNFSHEQMKEAVAYAQQLGKKVYVTVNVMLGTHIIDVNTVARVVEIAHEVVADDHTAADVARINRTVVAHKLRAAHELIVFDDGFKVVAV